MAWASSTLACVPPTEEEERPPSREASKETLEDGSRDTSKRRLKSKGAKDESKSASQHLAFQMVSQEEEGAVNRVVEKRSTRDLAGEHAKAYLEALRQLIDNDDADFSKLDNISDTL